MSFFKKIGSSINNLFGRGKGSGAGKSNVFQPAKKKGSSVPTNIENELRKIRAQWDQFTEEARIGINEEWRKIEIPDAEEPTPLPENRGRSYPVAKKAVATWCDWIPLVSSNVDRIRYSEELKQLQVVFKKKGDLYEYDGVEPEIFIAFTQTHSPGQYVWQILRAYGYPYRKLSTGHAVTEPAAPRYDETPFAVPGWIEEIQARAGRNAGPAPIAQKAPPDSNAPPKAPFTNEHRPTKRSFPPARP